MTCGKKEWENGSFSRVAIGECLVPDIEQSFFGVTDVEVTQSNVHTIQMCRPVRVNKTQSVPHCLKLKIKFKMDIDNNEVVSLSSNVRKVVTTVTSNQMYQNGTIR